MPTPKAQAAADKISIILHALDYRDREAAMDIVHDFYCRDCYTEHLPCHCANDE